MLSFWEASHNDFPVTQKHIHPCHQTVQYISSEGRFVVQSTISYNCNTYKVKYQRASNKNYIHCPILSMILKTIKHTTKYLEDWFLMHEIQGELILKIRGRKRKAIKLPVTIFGKACFKVLKLLKRSIWVTVSTTQRQNMLNKPPRLVCSHPLQNSAFKFHIFTLTLAYLQ